MTTLTPESAPGAALGPGDSLPVTGTSPARAASGDGAI